MKKYEVGDICTMWFIVLDAGSLGKRIIAYSDDKDYVDSYMEFHKCRNMVVKKVTNKIEKLYDVINENANDEIELYNLRIRSKKSSKVKTVLVPMTRTEIVFVNDESSSLMYSRIDYSWINEAFHYLKGKYQQGLKYILLEEAIRKVVYNKPAPTIHEIDVDEVSILFRSLPDQFG